MKNILKPDDNGTPIPVLIPGDTIKLSPSGSSVVTSTALDNQSDTLVRIVADADMHIKVGVSPTATTNDMFLPANAIDSIRIKSGYKIAAIGSGNLYITKHTN